MTNEIETDVDLVAAVLAGDETTQARFYELFKPRVEQTLREFTRQAPNDHEDLVQTVFIQLFRKLHTFKGDAQLSTWVYRVAKNQGLMYLRDYRTRVANRTASGDDALRPLKASRLESPEHAATRASIETAFRQLSPGYRAALYLHDVEGLEHSEIAELMNWHEGTSKSQLYRARLKMRKLINIAKMQRQSEVSERDQIPASIEVTKKPTIRVAKRLVRQPAAKRPINVSDFTPVEYIGANKTFKNKVGVIFTQKNLGRLFVEVNNPSAFTKAELTLASDALKLRLPNTKNLRPF